MYARSCDIPDRIYKRFVEAIFGDVKTAEYTASYAKLTLFGGRVVALIVEGEQIGAVIKFEDGGRCQYPTPLDPNDVNEFWFFVQNNN